MSDDGKRRGEGGGEQSRSARVRALIDKAQQHQDPHRRASLARKALRLDPESVEAYLLLGDEADDGVERADLYRQALDAAQRALGGQAPPEPPSGSEPRPAAVMRARERLGRALEELGLLREAATHYRALLRQDPADELEVRYHLAAVLFELGVVGEDSRSHAELGALQERFSGDGSARWAYDQALFAFREQGDSVATQGLAHRALDANPLMAPLLVSPPVVASVAPSSRDEREARTYVRERRELWQAVPDATRWLAEIAGAPLPTPEEARIDLTAPDELRLLDDVLARLEPDAAQQLSPLEGEVLALLEGEIDAGQVALRRYACGLWVAFAHSEQPRIRKPAVHAAAIEYVVAQILELPQLTQKELAWRYGIGPSSISRAAQAVDLWLDAALVDGLDIDGDELAEQLAEQLVEEFASELGVELDEGTVAELRVLPLGEEEWQGALRRAPFQVLEPRPHRPMLAMWYEQQGGSIVGQEIFGSAAPSHALLHSLVQAMFSPLAGEPRRPRALRVEDRETAEELRRQFGPAGIEVRHGELEGIATLMASLEQFMVRNSASSYLGEGVEATVVGRFFNASARLRRESPWAFVGAGQVLGVDLEQWGESRLCVSVIGNRGDERGLLIFHEQEEYLRYFRHAELSAEDGALVGAPVEMLSLVYEAGADLDTRQRREVFKHGWEVVGAEDYPMLYRFDADGGIQPLSADDYRIATVCAEAVAVYCGAHHELFNGDRQPPLRKLVKLQHCDALDAVCVIAPIPESHGPVS